MEKVFTDTDIIFDLLCCREPFYIHSASLFSAADRSELKVYVSSHSFANLNYILSKEFNASKARRILIKIKTLVTVLSVTDKIIELALASEFTDFEDAIQYHTAIENNISILLTRNIKHYKLAAIPVLTAEQYLKGNHP